MPAKVTMAGTAMLPVARITAASELKKPYQHGAGKNPIGVGQGGVHGWPLGTHRTIDPAATAKGGEHAGEPEHDGNHDGVRYQCTRVGAARSAERACDGGRDTAAHCAGRHHLHQHHDRENECNARQGIGSQLADEISFDQARRSLRPEHEDVGHRKPQQRSGDWGL